MMAAVAAVAVLVALSTAFIIAMPYVRRLLLEWYVKEVTRVAVPEVPSEIIVTYPLA